MTGPCLRDLRRAAGMSQRALAARVPADRWTIQAWERERLRISPAARARLLDVFADVAAERAMLRGALCRMQGSRTA